MINKFIKTSGTGIFTGKFFDNKIHQHYAIQINISLDKAIKISSMERNYCSNVLSIKPLVPHQLTSNDQKVLFILINPASRIGHIINQHFLKEDIEPFINEWTKQIRVIGSKWDANKIDNLSFLSQYFSITNDYFSECNSSNHKTDDRIINAINILEKYPNEVLSLEYISSKVFLSPSRFIHLFKEETGISYRRMQLWIKLMLSFDLLQATSNLTELAHASGFSDSAHYSRTFKETFGMKPSSVLKK